MTIHKNFLIIVHSPKLPLTIQIRKNEKMAYMYGHDFKVKHSSKNLSFKHVNTQFTVRLRVGVR